MDAGLTALVSLNVSNSRITKGGLQHLKPLKNMRSFTLESCKVTATEIRKLQSTALPNLKFRFAFYVCWSLIGRNSNMHRLIAELPLYLILGMLCGVVSVVFTRLVVWYTKFFEFIKEKFRLPAVFCPALGGLGLLAQLAAAKVVATALCKGSGLVGGLYAPSLMIGAAVGAIFGGSAAKLINSALLGNAVVSQPQAYALVGMAATLAYCLTRLIEHCWVLLLLPLVVVVVLNNSVGRAKAKPTNAGDDMDTDAFERFGIREDQKFPFLGKDRRDASRRCPGDEDYDPKTLYLPPHFLKNQTGGQVIFPNIQQCLLRLLLAMFIL
ncbi:Chloride channel protein CLC-f [Bienertia sinuspersici]